MKTKSYGLNSIRTVSYKYDLDGNRLRLIYPQGNQYIYHYTERNQLNDIQLDPALFGAQYQTPDDSCISLGISLMSTA